MWGKYNLIFSKKSLKKLNSVYQSHKFERVIFKGFEQGSSAPDICAVTIKHCFWNFLSFIAVKLSFWNNKNGFTTIIVCLKQKNKFHYWITKSKEGIKSFCCFLNNFIQWDSKNWIYFLFFIVFEEKQHKTINFSFCVVFP